MRANVEDRGIKGDCTPLMEAASGGYVDIVKLLIGNAADVNAQSSAGTYKALRLTFGTYKMYGKTYSTCDKRSKYLAQEMSRYTAWHARGRVLMCGALFQETRRCTMRRVVGTRTWSGY